MLYSLLTLLFLVCCVFLIAVILMQSGRGEGLVGTFGGSEVQSMLGPRAGDVLEKITWGVMTVFFILTIILSFMVSHNKTSISSKMSLMNQPPKAQAQPAQGQTQPATGGESEKGVTIPINVTPESSSSRPVDGKTVPITIPVGGANPGSNVTATVPVADQSKPESNTTTGGANPAVPAEQNQPAQ